MVLLSGLGIFFSILLLTYNKGYKSANIYLGLFLFSFNIIALTHYFYAFNNSKELSINISCLYLTINILLIINNIYGN